MDPTFKIQGLAPGNAPDVYFVRVTPELGAYCHFVPTSPPQVPAVGDTIIGGIAEANGSHGGVWEVELTSAVPPVWTATVCMRHPDSLGR